MRTIMLLCVLFAVRTTLAGPTETTATLMAETVAFNCYTCHGTDGASPADVPSLSGRSATYIKDKLLEYQSDAASATIMDRIAKALTAEQVDVVARYLADE